MKHSMLDPGREALAKSESLLRLLDALATETRQLTEPAEVMQVTARMLGQHLRVSRCAYARVDADQDHFDLLGDSNDGVQSIVGRYAFADFGAEVLRLMRADQPYVNADVDNDPRTRGTDLSVYRLTQIEAVICVPLHKDGRFVAALAVHQSTPRQWAPDEVALVGEVAARCWESLERLRSSNALHESNQRLQLAMAAGDLGDWSWDTVTETLTLSARAADMLGLSPDERVTWTDLRDRLHPDDREAVRLAVERALAEHGDYAIEYRVQLPGRGLRWISAQGRGTYLPGGQPPSMIGIVKDVTVAREAQERERDDARILEALLESERSARQEAERANTLKDHFLATLSHELRTPLSAILGWSQILRRKLPQSATDLLKGAEVIERSTRLQAQLIDDLLDMGEIASGKLQLDMQTVGPIGFVEAAIETVRPAANAGQVRIEAMLDPGAGPVAGDQARLQQIVWNLLANAVKFTPRGGKIQVRLERIESNVEITVADTGVGIEPEFLLHLFDRFRQADGSTTRKYRGLGLGLSIVKHLVELHGGRIFATSPGEGRGSTFTVHIPVMDVFARVNVPTPADAHHPEPPYAESVDLAGLNILVVDDEPDARDLLRRLLADCGASVHAADGAEAALEIVAEARPDLLISDIGMPVTDGYELLRRVRALGVDRGGSLPAIALTAFARSEDRVKATRAGFLTHVAKPVEAEEIISLVASVLGR